MVLPQPAACFDWSCVWCVTHALTCKGVVVQGWISSAVLSPLVIGVVNSGGQKIVCIFIIFIQKSTSWETLATHQVQGMLLGVIAIC